MKTFDWRSAVIGISIFSLGLVVGLYDWSKPEAPLDWLTAIATVAAVVIALWASQAEDRKQRRAAFAKGAIVASSYAVQISALSAQVKHMLDCCNSIEQGWQQNPPREWSMDSVNQMHIAVAQLKESLPEINNEELLAMVELPGEIGFKLARALSTLNMLLTFYDNTREFRQAPEAESLRNNFSIIQDRLKESHASLELISRACMDANMAIVKPLEEALDD